MFLESVTTHTREAGDQNARNQYVGDRYQNRQRRYQKRCQHRHHEEHRPYNTARFVQNQPCPRHHNKNKKKGNFLINIIKLSSSYVGLETAANSYVNERFCSRRGGLTAIGGNFAGLNRNIVVLAGHHG